MSYTHGISDWKQVLNPIAPSSASEFRGTESQIKTTTANPPAQAHTDEAKLSSAGGWIAQALESSDVRTGKVEALRQAIADGSYGVSSADVADKMVQSMLD